MFRSQLGLGKRKRGWTPKEDEKLKELVLQNAQRIVTLDDWGSLPRKIHRSLSDCEERSKEKDLFPLRNACVQTEQPSDTSASLSTQAHISKPVPIRNMSTQTGNVVFIRNPSSPSLNETLRAHVNRCCTANTACA